MTTSAISSATDASAFLTTSSVTGSIATAVIGAPFEGDVDVAERVERRAAARRHDAVASYSSTISGPSPRRRVEQRRPRDHRDVAGAALGPEPGTARRRWRRLCFSNTESGERVVRDLAVPSRPRRQLQVDDVDRRVRRGVTVGPAGARRRSPPRSGARSGAPAAIGSVSSYACPAYRRRPRSARRRSRPRATPSAARAPSASASSSRKPASSSSGVGAGAAGGQRPHELVLDLGQEQARRAEDARGERHEHAAHLQRACDRGGDHRPVAAERRRARTPAGRGRGRSRPP